jgi:hypothetical protein
MCGPNYDFVDEKKPQGHSKPISDSRFAAGIMTLGLSELYYRKGEDRNRFVVGYLTGGLSELTRAIFNVDGKDKKLGKPVLREAGWLLTDSTVTGTK